MHRRRASFHTDTLETDLEEIKTYKVTSGMELIEEAPLLKSPHKKQIQAPSRDVSTRQNLGENNNNEDRGFIAWWRRVIMRKIPLSARTIQFGQTPTQHFPPNVVSNQKYSLWSFIPVILWEQFRFFFNLYFLIVALSQLIPVLQVGFLFTYVGPLVFVLMVTICKEAYDDFKRFLRDKEANSQKYKRLLPSGESISIPSADIKVGDFIIIEKDQRVPADMIFLRSSEKNGTCFVRTDQLDGETDWKLRRTPQVTHQLSHHSQLYTLPASVFIEKPQKDIYSFIGVLTISGQTEEKESLGVDNTLWANTVVASGTVVGFVIYTGTETRSVMNTSSPGTKVGSLDLQINNLSKILCFILVLLSVLLVSLKGFHGLWYIYLARFLLLFSSIIPISLRVNLDLAKTVYSIMMMRDSNIPNTVVRSSTIPEELGRIEYLLTDKTGTLTQNEMIFKKLHVGVCFSAEALPEVKKTLLNFYTDGKRDRMSGVVSPTGNKIRKTETSRVYEALKIIALCHNVTPVVDSKTQAVSYQASSPDEIALVKFAEEMDLRLVERDIDHISLKNPLGEIDNYEVLNLFPFTSASKRMGIIVRDKQFDKIIFYLKGADVVLSPIVQHNEWLDEECGNMAREGLRTLVFGKRELSEAEYTRFAQAYHEARTSVKDREGQMERAVKSIESQLELLCLTGVEDRLQNNVKSTLEMLGAAGVKVWMLTGDKMETAKCIGISTRLVQKGQSIFPMSVSNPQDAATRLQTFSGARDSCLLIDGNSLQICLDNFASSFIEIACRAPSVICCRCSPTQKAEIVRMIKTHKQAITCSIGDGGNDVSMIQQAHVGVGIVGKEGMQASLAADFSVTQFSHIARLMLWHGRNSYIRSAHLSQFIIHRGLIISFIQAVFSALFYFAAVAIYNGWLLVGYSTYYTMAPVFSLVLDEDVSDQIAFTYPELYKELQKGRALSYKTFFIWVFTSIFQGGIIMLFSLLLFEDNLINIVAITFTALILTELGNVAFEIRTWNRYMLISEVVTIIVYFSSIFILTSYFDLTFILSWGFLWKVAVVTAVSCLPLYSVRFLKRRFDPPSYQKLRQ